MKDYYRVQADINLDAICDNIRRTRERVRAGTRIMGIIKADGYGHGAVPVARVLNPLVDAFGIAIPEEGIELRSFDITKPILLLGYTPALQYGDLIEYDIMPAVFTLPMAEEMSNIAVKKGKVLKIHIKVDTGMSRIGFRPCDKSIEEIKKISSLPGIVIDGCFTHFSKADETDKTFTITQLNAFLNFVTALEAEGVAIPVKHISNSAGIIDLPEANLDMVRSGISTYGLYPSDEIAKENLSLTPAMSIKAYISYVKEVEAGVPVSYGGTFITKEPTRIATIPAGYGDGYPRTLSNKGRVLIHGQSAPIIGRVCMDQFMVDVTGIEGVKAGDTATLLGNDGEEHISVEELAELAGTFHYEFVCDMGKRVPRVYYYHGRKAGTCDYYSCGHDTYELELS